MPPPPPGVTGKKIASPTKPESVPQTAQTIVVGKGKGRADDPVDISSDEEVVGNTANTSRSGPCFPALLVCISMRH